MVLLKGLLLIIIVGVILFIAIVVRLLWSARELLHTIFGGRPQRSNGTYGDPISNTDDTITDRRPKDEANRRIINDDEGEYVEFEEVTE